MEPEDRNRLAKLLGMTGSAHEGEAANAIRLANKLLRELKLTWAEALADARTMNGPDRYLQGLAEGQRQGFTLGYQKGKDDGMKSPAARQAREEAREEGRQEGYAQGRADTRNAPAARPRAWLDLCQEMLDQGSHRITDWEREFLTSYVTRRWHTPTPRQEGVLRDIARKLGMRAPDGYDS